MSKAERIIEMIITINAKKDFTVGELANEFSVKRIILRDLQELEQAGFPLYSEVGAAGSSTWK
jgi:predicted DNA-binding transcriptional regulator YafY